MSLAPILRFHGGGVETEVELVRSYINEIVVSKGTNANFHTGKSYTTNQLTYTRFGQLPSTRTCKGNRGPRNLGRRIPTFNSDHNDFSSYLGRFYSKLHHSREWNWFRLDSIRRWMKMETRIITIFPSSCGFFISGKEDFIRWFRIRLHETEPRTTLTRTKFYFIYIFLLDF